MIIYGLDDGTFYAIDTKIIGSDGENPIVRYGADGMRVFNILCQLKIIARCDHPVDPQNGLPTATV